MKFNRMDVWLDILFTLLLVAFGSILVVAMLSACVSADLLAPPTPTSTPTPCPVVEEYYRGAFDACLAGTQGQARFCRNFVASIVEQGWHELPTPGWRWPPGEPTPEREAGR